MPKFAFFHGKIVPFDEAKVSVMTHALNYGTGCFEGIRAYWNAEDEQLYAFRLLPHYQRLLESCKIMMIDLPYTAQQMSDLTVELLRKESNREDTYIRPLAYKSSEVIGVRLNNLQDDFTIFATPLGRYLEKEEGADVCISSWRRLDDNAIPPRAKVTGSYANAAFSKTEALLNGYDEAIVLDESGHISEGSAENLFIVRQGKLITPPPSSNILEGVTRATVLQLAREDLGLEVVERTIDRTELYVADEAFLCGTGVQVAAIASVDRRPVGAGKLGPVVTRIRDLYFDVVRGKVAKYASWCTPVYAK
ncbi:MAG: branched-chain amino acid transaminase [Chloroflexi bacterium]|nr:branched-chain amino acid transaminase [Chloroflexota bacterium]